MEIHQIKIQDLKPADYNPRKLTKDQHAQLTASIKKFGLVDPIIVNRHPGRENVVVGGHQRLKIASELGFTDVPVVFVDLDEKGERELNLRLNKNLGEWDWDMLANQFEIDDLKDIGFTSNELGFMQSEGEEDNFDADAEAEKIIEPESKRGEIYELGPHRLMCGDSTNLEDVEKLMGGAKADFVFTDPPYMVNYHRQNGLAYNGDGIENDNLSPKEAIKFYTAVLKNLSSVSVNGAPIYWWYASRNQLWSQKAFKNSGWKFSQVLIWVKNAMVFYRQDYHRCYEPCMYGWKKGSKHYTNNLIRNLKDVLALNIEQFADMLDIWFERRDQTQSYVHLTQKPIRLAGRAIRKSCPIDGSVIDLFGGSGSTLIAAEQLGRQAFLMELDPKYCDVIKKRYNQFKQYGTAGK